MKKIYENKRRGFLALVIMLVVSACATSPSPVYYTLAPATTGLAAISTNIAAEIGPFELPEYLDRPQIVTAGPGATLQLDEFNRWVEPLDQIFLRTLTTSVGRQLGSDQILATASHRGFDAPIRVLGSVQRFETTSDANAVLDAQWAIVDRDGNIVKPGTRSRYAADIGNPADIDARLRALGEVLEKFGADIANALRARPRH